MQVDEGRIFRRSAAELVQPLAIQAQGVGAGGKKARGFAQVGLADAANLRHMVGRVVVNRGFERIKPHGMITDVGWVDSPFPQHDVQHPVKECNIRSGLNR